MKITQDVRDYAAKHGVSDDEALKIGMTKKSEKSIRLQILVPDFNTDNVDFQKFISLPTIFQNVIIL